MAIFSIDVSDQKGLGRAIFEEFYSCAHVETLDVWVQVQGGGGGEPKTGNPGGWYKLTVRRLVNEKPRFMLLPIPIVVKCGRPQWPNDRGKRQLEDRGRCGE